jgi:hypothetical protein
MTAAPLKIALCFPSGDMVHADFALSFAGLCNSIGDFQTILINNKSSIVAVARNNAVHMAQEFGADFMLFLDSDMVFPRSTLHRLLAHGKDIVGATYTKRVPPFDVLGAQTDQQPEAEMSQGLIEMRHIPTGCLLIRMAVFDALRKPYFRFQANEQNGNIVGEDYLFCDLARAAGFRVWCDAALSAEIGHIGQRIYRLPAPGPDGQQAG